MTYFYYFLIIKLFIVSNASQCVYIYFCKIDLLEDIQGYVSRQNVANASPERLTAFIPFNHRL